MQIRLLAGVLLVSAACAAAPKTIGGQFVSFAGFTLDEETTLSEVQKRYGMAPLMESGEAGEYEASICYSTGPVEIGFLSGELGGPEHRLIGFSVAQSNGRHKCAEASVVLAALTPQIGGVHLGMTKDEFAASLGADIEWVNNEGRYSIVGEEPMTQEQVHKIKEAWPGVSERPYFDAVVSVVGFFIEGRLVEYRIWRVRTT